MNKLESIIKSSLPSFFKDYISDLPKERISCKPHEYKYWKIFTEEELLGDVNVGRGAFRTFELYHVITEKSGDEISFLTIGEDNGDYLLLRVKDGEIFYFWHDGQELEFISRSFQDFIEKSRKLNSIEKQNSDPELYGKWKAIKSKSLSEDVLNAMGVMEFTSQGEVNFKRENRTRTFPFAFGVKKGKSKIEVDHPTQGKLVYKIIKLTERELVLEGPNSKIEVTFEKQ